MSWWNIIKRQYLHQGTLEQLVDAFEEDPTKTKLAKIRRFLSNRNNEAYVNDEIYSKVSNGIQKLKIAILSSLYNPLRGPPKEKIPGDYYDSVYRLMQQRMESHISNFEAVERDFYHDKL